MRRLCLTLLCGLVAVPAALAAANATGDGVLEIKGASGTVVVTGSRGTVWGQMDSGRLVVTDPLPSDGTIFVNGAENIAPGRTDAVTIYTGRDLHFRVTGGKYKLSFKGSGIDLTAVGIGTAQLSGDVFADETGKFAVDSGKWSPIPPLVSRSVRFGVPPIAPPTTP